MAPHAHPHPPTCQVAVVRLCGPATHALPPFCSLPPALRAAVGGCYFLASGGYEYDGRREIAPLHEPQLRGIARQILSAGIRCVVVSGVFSPVQADQEERVAAILRAAAAETAGVSGGSSGGDGDPSSASSQQNLLVCCSHEIGQLGLLERENGAVLNAALLPLASRAVPACAAALAAAGLRAPLFFSGNDGTLLSADQALRVSLQTRGGLPADLESQARWFMHFFRVACTTLTSSFLPGPPPDACCHVPEWACQLSEGRCPADGSEGRGSH